MSNTLVQLRIDDSLKNSAVDLFSKLGIDLPTAIRMFLARAVQVRGIPFPMQLTDESANPNPAVLAMRRMSEMARENGVSDMTLDEINAEVNEVR